MRARKAGGHWGIFSRPRFGYAEGPVSVTGERDRIWIHAVSLGETRAAQPLIQALLDSGARLLLTHTTATGRAEGGRLYGPAIASGQIRQTWLPYDFPGSTRRFFKHHYPCLGVLIEREVWPNLLYQARRAGIPMILASARLSESSLRQARWLERALRRAYGSLEETLAQSPEDAGRLIQIGARNVQVVGNIKFDVALPVNLVEAGRTWRGRIGRPVVAIASTREGEDSPFADLFAASASSRRIDPLYLLIPRHPQRFDVVAELLAARNLEYERRSHIGDNTPAPETRVLLGDTLGEMAFYYAAADVAIIGGGFAPLGGQNLIEACVAGTPVILGPHMYNFAQAARDAIAAGAALQVRDPAEALRQAVLLLNDDSRRAAMRNAALAWVANHAGATRRIMQALRPWVER